MLDSLVQIGLPVKSRNAMVFAFDCMEIAEHEIATAKAKYPLQADLIDGLFAYLCPPPGMQDFGTLVYTVYVKEQIERVVDQIRIEHPTKAEILMVLSRMSEKAPLTPDATKLYVDLFIELFPERAVPGLDLHESYKGACEEIKRDIVRLIRSRCRKG